MALSQQDVRDIACSVGECPHVLTIKETYFLARSVGWDIEEAIIATAIARAESGLNTGIAGDLSLQDQPTGTGRTWGPSIGLWQVRSIKEDRGKGTQRDILRLVTSKGNASAAYLISSGGSKWSPWSVYNSGAYKQWLDDVRAVTPKGVGKDVTDEDSIVDAILDPIRNLVSEIVSAVKNTVGGLLGPAGDALEGIIKGVQTGIGQVLNTITTNLGNVVRKVGDELGKVVGSIAGSVSALVNKVTTGIETALKAAASSLADLATKIADAVGAAVESIAAKLSDIVGTITDTVGELVEKAGQVVGDIGLLVVETTGALIAQAGEGLTELISSVQEGANIVLANVTEGVGALVEQATGLPAAIFGVGQQIVEQIIPTLQGAGAEAASFLANPVEGILGGFFGDAAPELVERIEGIIARIENNPETPEEIRQLTRPGILPALPIFGLIVAVALPTIIGGIVTTVMQPLLMPVVQHEMSVVRPSLLTLGDAVNAYFRKERGSEYLETVAAKLGYTVADTELAVEVARPLPPPGDVLQWRHREIVTDAEARSQLQRQGWDDDSTDRFIEASYIIPPLQDLVRFAVREAFPGQVAYEGAAGAGVPARFAELAKRIGLNPEFARSYWAAHWDLPSPLQGFEMYHRGIISEAQLQGLLVALDIMPEWRQRLQAIAFNPLTRVDVRRMYAVGVLDRSGLVRAHLDLGYSPAHAELLTDFVVESTRRNEDDDTEPERDLTKSDLIGAFRDAIMTRDELVTALRTIGYDADESELLVSREELKIETAERKETKDTVTEQAVAGLITMAEAQDALSKAGMTDAEVKLTLYRIQTKKDALIAIPTRADLFRFHKAKLVTDDELRTGLQRIGYREPWLTRYVELAKKGQAPLES